MLHQVGVSLNDIVDTETNHISWIKIALSGNLTREYTIFECVSYISFICLNCH